MRSRSTVVILCAGIVALGAAGPVRAADAVRGKALFANTNGASESCASASCHSGFPLVVRNGITKATNPTTILSAISSNKGGMGALAGYVNATDAADIAAYIANPAAGNGAPAIALSASSLAFAVQQLGTTSAAQTVTVSNTGTAALNITGLAFSGGASAEFARAGTCQIGTSVAAGGNCSVQVTFTPAAAGMRSAALTISHNASGGASSVGLTGTGQLAPAIATVAPTTLAFTQTINMTSTAQAVTVTNTGGQALTLGAIALAGVNAADFATAAGSTCAAGSVLNASAGCVLQVTFRPTAAGARSASLSIAHNAAGSPVTVALSGSGTLTAQPGVSLSAAALSFGTVALGDIGAVQTVTLTNSGQAGLTLSGLALGGAAAAEFALAGTCASGMTVAPAASCLLQLTFAPTAVGSRNGTLTVTSNASNGNPIVALSGTGAQYAISVDPGAATFSADVGVASLPRQFVVANTGASPISLKPIVVNGPFALQQGSNSCGFGSIDLASGQSCNVYVAFLPAAAGTASGEVMIESASLKAPMHVVLSGQATAASASSPSAPGSGSSAAAPSNVGGGCTVGAPEQLLDPLLAAMLAVAVFGICRRPAKAGRNTRC